MGTVRYTVLDGEVIAEKRGGVRREYVPDPLGSTAALLDNTQTKTDTFAYWPYGEEATRTGTTATPLRYIGTLGYYRDSETKSYVRARHLSVQQGRWMTQDPNFSLYNSAMSIEFDPALLATFSQTQVNFDIYVGNAPVTFVDPTGLQRWSAEPGDPPPPNDTRWCGLTRRCPPNTPNADIDRLGINCIDRACGRHDVCLGYARDKIAGGRCDAALCQAATSCYMNGCKSSCTCKKCKCQDNCKYISWWIKKTFCHKYTPNGPGPFAKKVT